MNVQIKRDDVAEQRFPSDAQLVAVMEAVAKGTSTFALAVRVRLMNKEYGWWSTFIAPGDTDQPLEIGAFDWVESRLGSRPLVLPTIRMLADNQMLGRSNVVQQYDMSLQFGGFLDAFGFLFARPFYEYRRQQLQLEPEVASACSDEWAIKRLRGLGFCVRPV
jgi:hypothetical protein